jgi:hypothetical protein
MPAFVHEHARRAKAKFSNHHLGIHWRISERKNPYGIPKFDIFKVGLSHVYRLVWH